MTFHILAISGSLRAVSSNTALLRSLEQIVPPEVRIDLYQGLGALPYFNPDLEDAGLPASVADLRARVQAADAIVICSPEYAHGLPGVLKNALDWLVGAVEFPGKRVALFNTSPRATHAQDSLREILTTMSARIVDRAGISLPLLSRGMDHETIAADPEMRATIRSAIEALVAEGRD